MTEIAKTGGWAADQNQKRNSLRFLENSFPEPNGPEPYVFGFDSASKTWYLDVVRFFENCIWI